MDYIFIIYSCKKNIERANKTYEKIREKINNSKVYIIYGDININAKYLISDDKYIILNVADDYDNLNNKTLLLIEAINHLFPEIKGMFKCDDDVIINLNHLNNLIDQQLGNASYIGHANYIGHATARYKSERKNINNPHFIPDDDIVYCGGPLYYLSKKSIECFNNGTQITDIYYEDMLVGYHLNKHNIFPEKNNLYSDNIHDSPTISYHNKNHYNDIYIILQGGLGNQLFQLGCAMTLAAKYDKQLKINIRAIIPNPHQNQNINTTISTLKRLYPQLQIVNEQLAPEYFYTFTEENNAAFAYTEEKLANCFNTYNNVVLKGYFINYNYIANNANLANPIIQPDDNRLLSFDFSNTYFLHIRLGDYHKHPLHYVNLQSYYTDCVNRIISVNPDAKFYICTNQYDNVLQTHLNMLPKNAKYILQNKGNNDIDTLFIMSSCCGAICSNSTLSFMGALFQKKKEHIYMPYPYVNFINGFNSTNVTTDMYPEWCTIINA